MASANCARVRQVGGLRLHPQQVRERRRGEALGDGVVDAAADLVVALGRLGVLAVPDDLDAQRPGLLPGDALGGGPGEGPPLVRRHLELLALGGAELEHLGHGLSVGLQPRLGLPGVHEPRLHLVEHGVHGGARGDGGGALGDGRGEAGALEPGDGRPVLRLGDGVEQVAVQLADAEVEEALHERQVADLVGRQVHVGGAQDEGLVALVAAALEEVGRLGVGAGDDDPRHAHDVELEARRVEALDLLVRGHEHLAALVAALLGARALVLDVVARHAGLDEAADQVAHVRVAAVAGVGVGDDEGPEVDRGRLGPLLLGQLRAQVELVAVGGEQGPHERGRLVGDLAQRVAGEVGARVLGRGALGRGGPAAQVDALDAHALHRHRLAGRVGAEGGDALPLVEELAQPGVEGLRRLAGHGVVVGDGAPLLDHLARRVEAGDALRSGVASNHSLRGGDVVVEGAHAGSPLRAG